MERRQLEGTANTPDVTDSSVWRDFSTRELAQKRAELQRLVDSGTLTERSVDQQLTEIRYIEIELAKRDDG